MNLDDFEYNFIDEIYHYAGLWERKSTCGIKIVEKPNTTIIISTDLYKENPGGSITEFVAELAMLICDSYKVDISNLTFINHIPEVKSSLEFYAEAFYRVSFDVQDGKLSNPDWHKMTREEIKAMVDL